jgi:hypothetical protein
MRMHVQFLLVVFLVISSSQLLFAQDEFYNRDSSGYTYRIGPVLPKIQQDWQLGTSGRDFTFGFNPSGVNIENYVLSLLNLPDVRTALQASTVTDVYNYLLLQSFQSPTEASVLSNATSMMNQKLTIRMLQDVLRRLQLGPDPAASIQAGAQEKCVQLAASLGLISVEAAEKLCSGGLGGASRGIMIFGTSSTTDKILNGSRVAAEDRQLAKDLIIDFRTDPLSSGRQDVYRVMPLKSVSDVRQELEDAICQEVRDKVSQAASGTRAGGPLSVEGTIPLTADLLFGLARMEPSMKEVSIQSICRRQSLVATRAKITRLSQRFSQSLDGVSSNQDVPQVVREEYRTSLSRLLGDVDLIAKQMEFEERSANSIFATLTEQKRVEARASGSAGTVTRLGATPGPSLDYGTGR